MRPAVRKLKETVRNFHRDLVAKMRVYYKAPQKLRVRVIGFRDFYCDGPYALEESRFFELPEELDAYEDFVNRLEAMAGGDIPENSLEALAMAMQSDWYQPTDLLDRKRQLIVLITDASAHPLEEAASYTGDNYPADMPKSYEELANWWAGNGKHDDSSPIKIDHVAKGLLLIVPEASDPWTRMEDDFDACCTTFLEPEEIGEYVFSERFIMNMMDVMFWWLR